MNTQAQEKRILGHLLSGRTLTPLQALSKFDSWRLSGRILNLRKQGWKIKTEIVRDRKHCEAVTKPQCDGKFSRNAGGAVTPYPRVPA